MDGRARELLDRAASRPLPRPPRRARALDGWTTKDDVEATKPEPDLVEAALEKAGTEDATMLGDTPWDVEAARKAGLDTVCLVTGGFSEQELRDAGAVAVFESLA